MFLKKRTSIILKKAATKITIIMEHYQCSLYLGYPITSITKNIQSKLHWKIMHIKRIQFHIESRMQYITIKIFHSVIQHWDMPNINLSMWIITEGICRMKRNGLNISKVLKMTLIPNSVLCCPCTLSWVTSRSTLCTDVHICSNVSASAGWQGWRCINADLHRQVGRYSISAMWKDMASFWGASSHSARNQQTETKPKAAQHPHAYTTVLL